MMGADGFAKVVVHHHAWAIGASTSKEGKDAGTCVGVTSLEKKGKQEKVSYWIGPITGDKITLIKPLATRKSMAW